MASSRNKAKARAATGVSAILTLLTWIFQSYAPQSRALLSLLLILLGLSLAYTVYQYGWLQISNNTPANVVQFSLALALVIGTPGIIGFFLWPKPAPDGAISRLEITDLVPVPPSTNQEFILRVLFRNVGSISATNLAHRTVLQLSSTPLTPEKEEQIVREAASIKPRKLGIYDELHPNAQKQLFFSVPEPPSPFLTSQYESILAGKQKLYIFVALKYRDAALAGSEVRVTEFCGWFSGTLDSWGNCGHSRTFVEQVGDTPLLIVAPQEFDLIAQVHHASSGYMPIKEAPRPIIYVSLVASVENRGATTTANAYSCVVRTRSGKTTIGKSTNIPEGLTITHGQQSAEVLHADESLSLRTAQPMLLGKSVKGRVICWMDGAVSPEEIRQIGSVFELHFKDANSRPYVAQAKVTDGSLQAQSVKPLS